MHKVYYSTNDADWLYVKGKKAERVYFNFEHSIDFEIKGPRNGTI